MTEHVHFQAFEQASQPENLRFNDHPNWISTQDELAALVEHCLSCKVVAIDTEFERTSTYFANAGLIQLADGEQVYLIDPVALPDLSALAPLLSASEVVKVLHSMSEDVELLQHVCGVLPVNVFDTQLAATFLGLGVSMGYQRLVQAVLGLELDKSETRSDWLRRPLTDSQIAYAVQDTAYLIKLYAPLCSVLLQQGRLEQCFDECAYLIRQVDDARQQPELAYLKLRGAWALSKADQQLLQRLVMWRDALAIERNVPKSWVFSDALLINIVERPPKGPKDLYRLKGIKGASVKRFGQLLIEQLAQASEQALSPDLVLIDAPIKGRELDCYKRLKKIVARVAKQTGIPEQLLASRRHLEQVVVALVRQDKNTLPAFFLGWRKPLLAQALLDECRAA